MMEAERVLDENSSILFPLLTVKTVSYLEGYFLARPALSSLPSERRYAGLKCSPLSESVKDNNAFGTVSCMLPMEVYLVNEKN